MNHIINLSATQNIQEQLGFVAYSCVIQNPTVNWWYLPDAQHYVPPFVHNHVVALNGNERANIQWAAPQGLNQYVPPAGNATGSAVFDFREDKLGAAAGYASVSDYGMNNDVGARVGLANQGTGVVGIASSLLSRPATRGLTIRITLIDGGGGGYCYYNYGYVPPNAGAGQAVFIGGPHFLLTGTPYSFRLPIALPQNSQYAYQTTDSARGLAVTESRHDLIY